MGIISRLIGAIFTRIMDLIKTLVLAILVALLVLMSPAAFVEIGCRTDSGRALYQPILPREHQRALADSYLAYPRVQIAHSYEEYAKVIATDNPHHFNFLSALENYWATSCQLVKAADISGGSDLSVRSDLYISGIGYTADIALKAAYEETIGRISAGTRGAQHSPLDKESAKMARDFAALIADADWYNYDFATDNQMLAQRRTGTPRDSERRIALGIEFSAKHSLASLLRAISSDHDTTTKIHSIVSNISEDALLRIPKLRIVQSRPEGIQIETSGGEVLSEIIQLIALQNGEIIEIAGQDRILVSTLSHTPTPEALATFPRQGFDNHRAIYPAYLSQLADDIRAYESAPNSSIERIFAF
ncbi:hypothetical protein GCM10007939_16950 [Amylibacter marinus]|uniref:Uncharacterized protein n=1 Tax=Amylibacter marinus TaxID=1475483 RepID=A0ABQ5VVF3_9RHOB|nr:hypothetical protein [Amylibacter marinus]GLQ35412.1 hypothetical protein GCM10007939_16950 [Amylibacter marinus]